MSAMNPLQSPSSGGITGASSLDVRPNATMPATDAAMPIDELALSTLSPEEVNLLSLGLLPREFATLRILQRENGKDAAIAMFKRGKAGPFSKQFGDPDAMLRGARRLASKPDLIRLAKSVKAGDILAVTYNNNDNPISVATKGPFVHTLLCISDGPPAEFAEALGLTGDVSDPDSNRVLRSTMLDLSSPHQTVRLLRPTQGMAPQEAEKAIRRAIAFAVRQLGKPYDFAFTNTNGKGMNDAYYCSELCFKAYADPHGADLPIRLHKSAQRDEALGALSEILDALQPDNQGALTHDVAIMSLQTPVDDKKLIEFVVNKVAPTTAATRAIADTPARRAALQKLVEKMVAGKGFENSLSALQRFGQAEQAGRFKGPMGLMRRLSGIVGISVAGVRDAHGLTKDLGFFRCLSVSWRLTKALIPHADVLTNFLYGPNDPRSKQVDGMLNQLDGLARDAHRVPYIGKFWPLPSRARPVINKDFVSPSDLAWADLPHEDFNVQPGHPIDAPAKKPHQGQGA